MKRHDDTIQVLLLVAVVVTVLIALVNRSKEHNRLRTNHVVVCGLISNVNEGRGGNYLIKYSYYYCSMKYQSGGFCSAKTYDKFIRGQKEILVVVEKNAPKNSDIIQDTLDFERLNIIIEDTIGINCGGVSMK